MGVECVNKIVKEKAKCTIVLPYWRSAPYWPCLINAVGQYKSFVTGVINLRKTDVVVKGKGNNGIFSRNPLPFDMLALKTY